MEFPPVDVLITALNDVNRRHTVNCEFWEIRTARASLARSPSTFGTHSSRLTGGEADKYKVDSRLFPCCTVQVEIQARDLSSRRWG